MYNLKSKAVVSCVFILCLLCSFSEVSFASLSCGHEILIEKGFQIQGLCSPQMWDMNYPPVPPVQAPDMVLFLESNFTGMSLLGNAYPEMYFGDMPGMQWGRWANLSRTLRTEELPYLPTMVGFEYDDEADIADPCVLEDANDWFTYNRANYPNVISFANQYGTQFTLAELQNFVAYCKPDMVCFDAYPFEGPFFTTYSAPWYYGNLGIYRDLGLAGHDGTGAEPIPYGMYLQTYVRSGHTPSESEMRLNMFSGMTFGYKFMQAFVYTNGWPVDELQSILFTGIDDQDPTAQFYEMAEINREARNLGSTLVRLLSTDLGVIKGIHAIDGGTEENNVPTKVWDANDPNNDPYITDISATYVEHPTVRGDVFVGYFNPLVESDDGPDYENEIYFMVFCGETDPTEDSNHTRHDIRIDFDFGNSGITSLLRLNRDTGKVETVTLTSDGGSEYHLDFTLPGGTADLFKFNTGAFFIRKTVALNETFGTNLDAWTVLDTNSTGGTVDVSVSDGNMTVSLTNNDRLRNQGVQSKERFVLPAGGKLVVDSYCINTGGDDSHCYPYVSVEAHASTDGYWNGSLTSWAAVKGWDAYYGDWAQTSLGGYTDLAGANATTLKHTIIVIDESNVKMYIEDDYYENLSNPTALYTTATSNIFTSEELADGLYVSLTAARYTAWYTGLCKEIFNGVKVQYLYPPTQAISPSPANGATGVSITADLSWTAGVDATSHDVYFGTNQTNVTNATHASAEYKGNQAGTSYVPGTLTNKMTYYWRIDEVGSGGTTTGTVWSFTTIAAVPTFVAAGAVTSGTGAITPALPTTKATNDILLLFLETSNQAISISNQNGGTWTQVTNSPQYCGTAAGTTGVRLAVFWSRYNGTQGNPTTSDSGDHQAGRIIGIRGATTSGNPWNVTAGGVEAASDTSGSIPGATTTVGNTFVVAVVTASLPDATGTANFSSWANANLTSVTERTDNTVTAGNGGGLGVVTGIKATAGTYGNTTVTLASSAYKGMMSIAIKP